MQFIVVGTVDEAQFTVLGRCGALPISVGDTFDAVYRYQRQTSAERGDDPVREVEKPADIGLYAFMRTSGRFKCWGRG